MFEFLVFNEFLMLINAENLGFLANFASDDFNPKTSLANAENLAFKTSLLSTSNAPTNLASNALAASDLATNAVITNDLIATNAENLGFLALFAVSFISASLYPLASEAFVVGFVLFGFDAVAVFCVATLGNTLGACSTYFIGLCGEKLVQRFFAKANAKIHAFRHAHPHFDTFFARFGFVFAFFSFLPLLGDLFVLVLGLLKYPFLRTLLFITLGKAFRYGLLIYLTLKFA